MGTDIHLYIQRRGTAGLEPDWVYVPLEDTRRKRWDGQLATHSDDPEWRNYAVFGYLAGVRQALGDGDPWFGGRGLPDDIGVTDEPYEDGGFFCTPDGVWLGDHSYTWAMLRELLDAPWDAEEEVLGVVRLHVYARTLLIGRSIPNDWRWSPGGIPVAPLPEHKVRDYLLEHYGSTIEAAIARLALMEHAGKPPNVWVKATWQDKPLLRSSFYHWLQGAPVQALANRYGAENVRVTMGFDS